MAIVTRFENLDITKGKSLRLHRQGFTFLEAILAIFIILVLWGIILPMFGTFEERRKLDASALKLMSDLMQAQQFARSQRNDSQYYGVRFFSNLGNNQDRYGYKILCYNTTPPFDMGTSFTITKSSVAADNPEFLEDTFFEKNVVIDADSEFKVGEVGIVFNRDGSATTNGSDILDGDHDDIILSIENKRDINKTINIIGLTGYIRD